MEQFDKFLLSEQILIWWYTKSLESDILHSRGGPGGGHSGEDAGGSVYAFTSILMYILSLVLQQ